MRRIEWLIDAHGRDPAALRDVDRLRALFHHLIDALQLSPVADGCGTTVRRRAACRPMAGWLTVVYRIARRAERLVYAHSDYGALPLFEEAQASGVHAADAVLQALVRANAAPTTGAWRADAALTPCDTLGFTWSLVPECSPA